MKAALIELERASEDLSNYLEALSLQDNILAESGSPMSGILGDLLAEWRSKTSSSANKKRFDYNTIIISLYGIYERYVEALIRSFLIELNEVVPEFTKLPKPIQDNHVSLSFDLIKRADLSRYHGGIDPNQIIKNLNSCLRPIRRRKGRVYRLNVDAFTYHSANLRVEMLSQLFSGIGVAGILKKCTLDIDFRPFLTQRIPDREIDAIDLDVSLDFVNELSLRRNDVAHGFDTEILSKDLLQELIDCILEFSRALYRSLCQHAFQHLLDHRSACLGKPIKVLTEKSVVCINSAGRSIKIGDYLFGRHSGSDASLLNCGPIVSIEINNEQIEVTPDGESLDIGLLVRVQPTVRQKIYHVKSELLPTNGDWLRSQT